MDSIQLRNVSIGCIIGVNPPERQNKQTVIVSVTLHGHFHQAGQSDRLEDTVDYAAVKERLIALVEKSSYRLLEALAQSIADLCLAQPQIDSVDVVVEKPAALSGDGSVAVEIHRPRPGCSNRA